MSRRAAWARWLGVGPSLAALVLGALVWPYTVDDAYVIARYATRLATGHGYTFVEGAATDGVTGPLFLLPGVLASWVHVSPVEVAKGVGLLSGALAVFVLVSAAERRVVGRLAAPVAGAFLVLAPSYLAWSVAGLETGGAALLAIVLAAATILEPRPWAAGGAAALLVTLRPECIPLVFTLLAYLARRRGREATPAVVLAVLGVVLMAGFRWVMFGALGPLSALAKPPDLVHGLSYSFRVLTYGTSLVAIPIAAIAARGSRRMRVLGVAILVHVAAITAAGGDWMPGVRLFVPALPLLSWMVGVGVSDVARRGPGRGAIAALIAVVLGAPLCLFVLEAPRLREAGATREHEGRALAEYLDAHAHVVALVDIGYLSYVGHFVPVDLAGITDPSIGRLPGGHVDKPVTGGMLIDRGVDAIVLHSATEPGVDEEGRLTALAGHPLERRLAMDETVRRAFRVAEVFRYADGYYYAVLLRRSGAPEVAR